MIERSPHQQRIEDFLEETFKAFRDECATKSTEELKVLLSKFMDAPHAMKDISGKITIIEETLATRDEASE